MSKLSKRDKIIIKDTLEIGVETGLNILDKIIPGISVPYKLSKALYGAGMKLRQERVIEWVEMVKENPSYFSEQVLSDASFQDGFVLALEKYLVERNDEKRKIFREVFKGFSSSESKIVFPLEKFIHTLSQLGEDDVRVLKAVNPEKQDSNYQIFGNTTEKKASIHNLINLGLLFDTTGTRGGYDSRNSPFVRLSPFGLRFIKYLIE